MSAEIETLHKPFIKFLREQGLPYIRARSDRQSTIAKGAHDFTVFLGRYTLCIEFKDKGKLSADQEEWIAAMEAIGTTVYVIRDLGDAVELVNAWRTQVPVPLPRLDRDPATTVTWKGASLRQLSDGTFERVKNT